MRQGIFGRSLAVLGILTGGIGVVCEALRPVIGPAYLVYGLLLPLWFLVAGVRLLRIGALVTDAGHGSRRGAGARGGSR